MIEVNDEQLVLHIEGSENVKKFKKYFNDYFMKKMLYKFIKDGSCKDDIFEIEPDDKILVFKPNIINYINFDITLKCNPEINIAQAYYKMNQNGQYTNNTRIHNIQKNYKDREDFKNIEFVYLFTFIDEKLNQIKEIEKTNKDIRYSYYLAKYYEKEGYKQKAIKCYNKCYEQKYRFETVLSKLAELSEDIKYSIELFKIKETAGLALNICYYIAKNSSDIDFQVYYSKYKALKNKDEPCIEEEKEKLIIISKYMNTSGYKSSEILKLLLLII